MPLATKNNALILKDGKIAENCGCCGDWYCCLSTQCPTSVITGVDVEIYGATDSSVSIQGVLREYRPSGCNLPPGTDLYWRSDNFTPMSQLNGLVSLNKVSESDWEYQFPNDGAGCSGPLLRAVVLGLSVNLSLTYPYYFFDQKRLNTPPPSKSLSDMTCTEVSSGVGDPCHSAPFLVSSRLTTTQAASGSVPLSSCLSPSGGIAIYDNPSLLRSIGSSFYGPERTSTETGSAYYGMKLTVRVGA
jgi:hypothetical protein